MINYGYHVDGRRSDLLISFASSSSDVGDIVPRSGIADPRRHRRFRGCARKRKGERYLLPPILPPFYHQANVVPDLPSLAHPCGSPAGELFIFLFLYSF